MRPAALTANPAHVHLKLRMDCGVAFPLATFLRKSVQQPFSEAPVTRGFVSCLGNADVRGHGVFAMNGRLFVAAFPIVFAAACNLKPAAIADHLVPPALAPPELAPTPSVARPPLNVAVIPPPLLAASIAVEPPEKLINGWSTEERESFRQVCLSTSRRAMTEARQRGRRMETVVESQGGYASVAETDAARTLVREFLWDEYMATAGGCRCAVLKFARRVPHSAARAHMELHEEKYLAAIQDCIAAHFNIH